MIDDVRAAAATFNYPWDARAVEWKNIGTSSTVIEVGGYTGRWALQIAERYQPRLYVFEPQGWAVDVCREVLGERAEVFSVGLGTETNHNVSMSQWETDGCTFVGGDQHSAKLCEIGEALEMLDITHIDLMLINIEGYEYQLIPHMLNKGILPQRLMVQFHTFADPNGMQTATIYERLAAAGYRILWTYGVVLTAWERT